MVSLARTKDGTLVTQYGNLRGVDFSSGAENVHERRTPTGTNMISDEGGNPKKRRGWEKINSQYEILQTWSFAYHNQEHLICHVKERNANRYHIIRWLPTGVWSASIFDVDDNVIGFYTATDVDSVFNVICQEKMYEYLWSEVSHSAEFVNVEPYIPIISIGASMSNGGGTPYENLNLITKEVREGLLGTTSFSYDTDTKQKNNDRTYSTDARITCSTEIDTTKPVKITIEYRSINKSSSAPYTYSYGALENGTGTNTKIIYRYTPSNRFWSYTKAVSHYVDGEYVTDAPTTGSETMSFSSDGKSIRLPANTYYPMIDGEDNVEVQYFMSDVSTNYTKTQSAFLSCTHTALYDNRVWFTGAKGDYGNRVWYSNATHDAYYPELNYIVVGSNDTDAVGLCNLGEYLGIVKQPSAVETTVFLAYPTTFETESAYACKNYVSGVGAVASATFVNTENETLFLAEDGIYGLNINAVKNRSYYLNKRLCNEPNLENAVATMFNRYYILCVNDHCYVLDTRQKLGWQTEYTNYNYAGYYWDNIPARGFVKYNGELWFIHTDGSLCRFRDSKSPQCYRDDVDTPIYCEWSTPLDDDGSPQLYKTLQKKGTVATLVHFPKTSAELYINLDDNKLIFAGVFSADPEDTDDAPLDCFFKKKVKKYKRLQLIIRNNVLDEPFMVESITKTYMVQGYAKRKSGDGVIRSDE